MLSNLSSVKFTKMHYLSDGYMSKSGAGALWWVFMQVTGCNRKNDPYFGVYYNRKEAWMGSATYLALSSVAR